MGEIGFRECFYHGEENDRRDGGHVMKGYEPAQDLRDYVRTKQPPLAVAGIPTAGYRKERENQRVHLSFSINLTNRAFSRQTN